MNLFLLVCSVFVSPLALAQAQDLCVEDGGIAGCVEAEASAYYYSYTNHSIGGTGDNRFSSESAALLDLENQLFDRYSACTVEISNPPWHSLGDISGCGSIRVGGPLPAEDLWTVNWCFGKEAHHKKWRLRVDNSTHGTGTTPQCGYPLSLGNIQFVRSRDVSCPTGYSPNYWTEPTYDYCWRSEAQPNPLKNLGCQPNCTTGNPVHAGTGNKYQSETDYVGGSGKPLALTRHYNSLESKHYRYPKKAKYSQFGINWRSNYDRSISPPESASKPTAYVYRPDGRVFFFKLVDGAYQEDPDVRARLEQSLDTSGALTGFIYTDASNRTEQYDASGRLHSISDLAGRSQVLTYNSDGRLETVSDHLGRELTFTYHNTGSAEGAVATMTDPDGKLFTYEYDDSGNLSSVSYPDSDADPSNNLKRTYIYEDPDHPNALTGITDESGDRYATWTYDSQGRAKSSEHAGGADKVTLVYNANGTTTVTDALNNVRTYTFETINGVVKMKGLARD